MESHVVELSVDVIHPSPYQQRQSFPEHKLAELARSIERDGLIQPIVVRQNEAGFEMISGERRLRAVRDKTALQTILARVVIVTDLQARRMCAAENLQRDDLTERETLYGIVELIDAELFEEPDYVELGPEPLPRVEALLKKLDAGRIAEKRGAKTERAGHSIAFVGKFADKIEQIFAGLPKQLDPETFRRHDLPYLKKLQADPEIAQIADANKLNKSQTEAIVDLKKEAPEQYQAIVASKDETGKVAAVPVAAVPDKRLTKKAEETGQETVTLQDVTATAIDRVIEREQAANELAQRKQRVTKRKSPPLPPGQFNLILADPPWRYDFSIDDKARIEAHYPTLSLEEICELVVEDQPLTEKFAKDCVLFCWTTSPKLLEGIAVVKAWGFTYKTCAIWHKQGPIGMGYYFRQDHEILLVATKGSPGAPAPANRPSSVILAPKGEHSEKPQRVHEILEAMYPEAGRLELFARGQARPGWTTWGNEVEGEIDC